MSIRRQWVQISALHKNTCKTYKTTRFVGRKARLKPLPYDGSGDVLMISLAALTTPRGGRIATNWAKNPQPHKSLTPRRLNCVMHQFRI